MFGRCEFQEKHGHHDYDDGVIEDGVKIRVCRDCGDIDVDPIEPDLQDDFDPDDYFPEDEPDVDYTPIYSIFLPHVNGGGGDFIFFAEDPELTDNAEVLIPHDGYGITIYMMDKLNHELVLAAMFVFEDFAPQIIEHWHTWQQMGIESMPCLICNRDIAPLTIKAQTWHESITGPGHWVDIIYTCPDCGKTMRYSRQWEPPMDEDMLSLVLSGEEDL